MALHMNHMYTLIIVFGLVSFICGVIAENKKAAAGTAIPGKGVVICKYPSDPTVALGYVSFAALLATTFMGYKSIYYPYDKKAIPHSSLFSSNTLKIFFNIAWLTAGLGAALLLWPTITQQGHLRHTVHHDPDYGCPTAKTGVIGGGAFVSLDSALIWVVCLMLANNARQDYFEEIQERVPPAVV